MAKSVDRIATRLGAEIVDQLPDVGGGALGAARLAGILKKRLVPSRGERPGRPTDPDWVLRPKVPMTKETLRKLEELAERISTPKRKVSPMQVAAQLLEDSLKGS